MKPNTKKNKTSGSSIKHQQLNVKLLICFIIIVLVLGFSLT